jgi:hypothetical protein
MTQHETDHPTAEHERVLPPQGEKAGIPYDLRRPTAERAKSRLWNRNDHRLFPPKSFGAGWTINFYWLFHLVAYFKGRGQTPRTT